MGGQLHDNDWYGLRMEDVAPLPGNLVLRKLSNS